MATRVLVLTDDRLGPAMAGPAIRALELARALSRHLPVTLASTQPVGELPDPGFAVVEAESERLYELARAHDALLAGSLFYAQRPRLLALDRALALDLYAPFLLEDLARLDATHLGAHKQARHRAGLDAQLVRADFMLAASERQRDYWLGRLCALRRLDPATHAQDPAFRQLLAVVPFGIPATPPNPGPSRLRAPGDRACICLWGGGIWDWLDPLTPIRAVAALPADSPVRLVFWGGKSPNPTTPVMPMAESARALAKELGVLDTRVVFWDAWVPYAERGSVLLEADAGFMAHHETLESRFAFRTRALDTLWAGRPILCTRGDVLAERVEAERLGLAVAPGDVAGWVAAFQRLAAEPGFAAGCRARVEAVRPTLSWEAAAGPLVDYMQAPRRTGRAVRVPAIARTPGAALEAWHVLAAEGPRGLVSRLQRMRGRRSP